jgi:hypothetical protein
LEIKEILESMVTIKCWLPKFMRYDSISAGRSAPKKDTDQGGDDEGADEAADESADLNDTTGDEPATKSENLEGDDKELTDADGKGSEPKKKQRKKRNMLLGLEIPVDAALSNDEPPVRASRRIAQLRIKKEADKSRIEDEAQEVLDKKHHKKDKSGLSSQTASALDKKKRKKQRQESEEDAALMKVLTRCI